MFRSEAIGVYDVKNNILNVLNYKRSDVALPNTHDHEPTYENFPFWVEYPFNLTVVCVAQYLFVTGIDVVCMFMSAYSRFFN